MMKRFAGFSLIALTAALAACASTPPEHRLPTEAFPIQVEKARAHLRIPVAPDQQVLNYDDVEDLKAFAAAYRDRGHGEVSIALPVNSGNDEAALRAMAQLRNVLNNSGIRHEWMGSTRYDAQGQTNAPVVAMFTHYEAIAPDCFRFWSNFGYTQDAPNTANFGCANQANLALMVADPRDLVEARAIDPADGLRRSAILEKYRAGETTITQRDDSELITISDAVE
jgi:pilus assembly protein CpaD